MIGVRRARFAASRPSEFRRRLGSNLRLKGLKYAPDRILGHESGTYCSIALVQTKQARGAVDCGSRDADRIPPRPSGRHYAALMDRLPPERHEARDELSALINRFRHDPGYPQAEDFEQIAARAELVKLLSEASLNRPPGLQGRLTLTRSCGLPSIPAPMDTPEIRCR